MSQYPQSGVAEIVLGPAPDDAWAELDVEIERPDGTVAHVPAFASGGTWRFRYSSEQTGSHSYRVADAEAAQSGSIEIVDRPADADGLARGGIRVTADDRRFEHADGTPFLWTGDTWWHGFVTEKISDDEFQELAERRAAEGFTVVQIVVQPPEATPFAEAVRCRTGWTWEEGYTALNLSWFDDADLRVRALVEAGLVPCIVGSWGYHLAHMEDRAVVRQWREMVARWAAYPVTWCLGGEPSAVMFHPDDPERPAPPRGEPMLLLEQKAAMAPYAAAQLARLNLAARYLRGADPFRRPVTTHVVPGEYPWELVEDESTLDFWMLQTGHGGYADLAPTLEQVAVALAHEPTKPVINGEMNYEGIGGGNWEDVQRIQFWTQILSGIVGFTYGAHGVWAMNTEQFPGQYSGLAYPWKEASRFRGGLHVGASSAWLRTVDWTTLTPRDDLVSPTQNPTARLRPYAAEFADGSRLVYLPQFLLEGTQLWWTTRFENLGGRDWRARFVDPRTGTELVEFGISPDADDSCVVPADERPSWADWLVLLRPA